VNAALWDPLQCEMLAAMGLPVQRAIGPAATDVAPAAAMTNVAVPAADMSSAPAPSFDDPLILALLRAAGRVRSAADAAQLASGWPSPQALRRDPAAKRALWPQLRALRRTNA
jgi:hypothetical protein